MEKLRVAVIGCGSISDIYMTNITSGKFQILELAACSDLMVERMQQSAAKYGCKAMTIDEICADSTIDMVINLTIPAAHYPVIKQCLEAGKHVFSEKMIAVELWQGKELVELANAKGLYLGVAPDTFLGASVQTAKYIVESGLIGKPVSCRASISRNYGIYGEFLTHLCKRGGGIGFDMGGYYLTALAAILGPVEAVSAFTAINDPDRTNTRVGAPNYGEDYKLEDANVITATMKYANGVLGTLHMNSDCILDETYGLEIYGTDGILYMGNPNEFGNPVYIQKTGSGKVEFPLTHGFSENSRGVGAAEMAWSIVKGRPNRASKEMAFHVFELMHGIIGSAESGETYKMESTFETPRALPAAYMGDGGWTRKEESALTL
ncbi:MAG: Gfo/Idh/MocA family oxidoreductase [Oscillospiraceae bacterium]|nr:Gfo/Idh/MocA family oxidoreductase [Oscillospiraceae bacterium]